MFLLAKPTNLQIQSFITTQRELPFSYPEIGATGTQTPAGYTVDHNQVCLGNGAEIFERAKAAVRCWEMFNIGWIQLCWPDTPVEVGSTVAILARTMGIWTVNACRIVYVVEEKGEIERFGFAYGTLPEHPEKGEERFRVEWRRQDDSVWYDILAFSRPNSLLVKLGYPFVRGLQKRFAKDSKQAMVRAISTNGLKDLMDKNLV
jgi:uncharacterized protein (UPF0548 family)